MRLSSIRQPDPKETQPFPVDGLCGLYSGNHQIEVADRLIYRGDTSLYGGFSGF
ncbi:MAG TPA: hypothetical protein VI320_22610 [Terracidiphilus sp.]